MVTKHAALICCLSYFSCYSPSVISAAPLQPDGGSILKEAIQQRNTWTTAHLKIVISADGNPAGSWDVYIDGSKVKGTTLAPSPSGGAGLPSTLCAECYTANSIVKFEAQSEGDDSPGAVSIFDTSLLPSSIAWIPDPRTIGLTSSSVFVEHGIHLDTYYSKSLMKELLISDDTFDDRKCVRLSLRRPTTELDVWVDEDKHSLISARLLTTLGDTRLEDQVVNSYQQVGNFWVLSESKFTRQNGNKQQVVITNVEFESIDKELPPNTFSLSSIPGLKPKSHVFWVMPPDRPSPFPDDPLFWDGDSIVRGVAGDVFPDQDQASSPERRGVRWLFWLNGMAVCGVLLYILTRNWQKRR